jgi:translation initiation factor 5A
MPGTDRVEIRTLKEGRFCVVEEEAYKILSISKSKPGKHGSATDTINVPMIEKGTAMVTHIDGNEVHAMNMRDHSMMILPMESELNIEAGKEIMWMEALGRYKIIRDH